MTQKNMLIRMTLHLVQFLINYQTHQTKSPLSDPSSIQSPKPRWQLTVKTTQLENKERKFSIEDMGENSEEYMSPIDKRLMQQIT